MPQWNSAVEQKAKDLRLRNHLNDFVGISSKELTRLESKYSQDDLRSGELTLYGTLRKRADGQFALETLPRMQLTNECIDHFLEDCLDLLGVDENLAGYYHPEFNQHARVHVGVCDAESVGQSHHYSQKLLDVMAELRGHNIVTNIGQSGCLSCGIRPTPHLIHELKNNGTPILGYVGFPAQEDIESPNLAFDSFDTETLSVSGVGYLVRSILEKHDVLYYWDERDTSTINTYHTV